MALETFLAGAQVDAPASRVDRVNFDNSGERMLQKANAELEQTVLGLGNGLLNRRIETDVMAANGEYNTRMDALAVKLMSNKEGAAQDNVQLFEDGRKKVMEEVLKKFRYAGSGAGKQAFLASADRDWSSQRRRMALYQAGELEKYQNTALTQQKSLMLGQVASQFKEDDVLSEMIDRGDVMVATRFKDYGAERVGQEQHIFRAEVVTAAVQAALAEKDWERANDLLELGQDVLPPEHAEKLTNDLKGRVLTAKSLDAVDNLWLETGGNYGMMLDKFKKGFLSSQGAERDVQLKLFDKEFDSLKRQARRAADANFERTQAGIREIMNGGLSYKDMVDKINAAAAGDEAKQKHMIDALDREFDKGHVELSPAKMRGFRAVIAEGKSFDSAEHLDQYLFEMGVVKRQRTELGQVYKDWVNRKGIFAAPMNDVEALFKEDLRKSDAYKNKTSSELNAVWTNIKWGLEDYIDECYIGGVKDVKAGTVPTKYQLLDKARQMLVKQSMVYAEHWYGDAKLDKSEEEYYAAGIRGVPQKVDGGFQVIWTDRRKKPEIMSGDRLNEYLESHK